MPSKRQLKKSKEKHLIQKRRGKYRKVLKKYQDYKWTLPISVESHKAMINELLALNIKHLQQLLSDLISKHETYYVGEYRKMIIDAIEHSILERTILK